MYLKSQPREKINIPGNSLKLICILLFSDYFVRHRLRVKRCMAVIAILGVTIIPNHKLNLEN